jgi:hypothetical protein
LEQDFAKQFITTSMPQPDTNANQSTVPEIVKANADVSTVQQQSQNVDGNPLCEDCQRRIQLNLLIESGLMCLLCRRQVRFEKQFTDEFCDPDDIISTKTLGGRLLIYHMLLDDTSDRCSAYALLNKWCSSTVHSKLWSHCDATARQLKVDYLSCNRFKELTMSVDIADPDTFVDHLQKVYSAVDEEIRLQSIGLGLAGAAKPVHRNFFKGLMKTLGAP